MHVRKLVGLATAATLCLGVTACTSDAEPAPSPTRTGSASATVTPETLTLRVAVYGPEDQVEAYQELATAFSEQHPEVTVELESAPDAEALMAEVGPALATGEGPDVFLLEREQLPALVAEERVQPVDALLEERQLDFGDGFQRDGLEAFSADMRLQCMPHDVSPTVVYYNEDLVDLGILREDEEDEPLSAEDGWSWEEFDAVARSVAGQRRTKGVHVEPSLRSLAPFLWSAGGELVDDDRDPTTLTLSDDENRETLEVVLALLRDPRVTLTERQLERADALTHFTRGRLGMILGTRELTPHLRRVDGLEFEVMPLPRVGRFRSVPSMSAYCIAADTGHVEAAADFLAFAVGREGAAITTRPGYVVPSNVEVQHSPVFTQPRRAPENSFVFSEGVRRTNLLPFVPEWPELERATQPLFEEMLNAPVIDLEELLAEIDETSRGVLAD